MDIITVVNGAGVERNIHKGNMATYERAGFKPKTAVQDPPPPNDNEGSPTEEESRANHPSSRPAKGKKETTPNGDAAS